MANKDHSLDPLIIKASKEEFLNNGYNNASLRNIAAKCNITTGALYTRYKNKDELFESLIKNAFNGLENNDEIKIINKLYFEAKEEKNVQKFIDAIKKKKKKYIWIFYLIIMMNVFFLFARVKEVI